MAARWICGAAYLSLLSLPFGISWAFPSSHGEFGGQVDGVPIGGKGQPLAPGPARYTSGGTCPPPLGSLCDIRLLEDYDEIKSCSVHERVTCRPDCHGYDTRHYACDPSKPDGWGLRETHKAACECEPQQPPADLAACTTRYVSVQPSDRSLTDGCALGLSCDGIPVWVACDGENDGTSTSLCDCWIGGQDQRALGGPTAGEGPEACFAAAARCMKSIEPLL